MKNNIDKELKLLSIRERLGGILYPRVCPVCGSLLTPVKTGDLKAPARYGRQSEAHRDQTVAALPNPYICEDCYKEIDCASGKPRCLRCSKPLDGEGGLCPDCAKKTRLFTGGIALMIHTDAARKMLYDFKYSHMRDNADFPAFEGARRFHHLIGFWDPDVIIPVPLHWRREHVRGYNQAGLLAGRLALFLKIYGVDIPVDEDYLVRQRQTLALKELSPEERSSDLERAFAVKGTRGAYKTVLLVDDIFTTGATINECARVLLDTGCEEVYFFTASIGS